MSMGPWQLIIIAIVILVLFGRGRISEMMGDFGKGIKSFKQGMTEDADTAKKPTRQIEGPADSVSGSETARPDAQPADRNDSAN